MTTVAQPAPTTPADARALLNRYELRDAYWTARESPHHAAGMLQYYRDPANFHTADPTLQARILAKYELAARILTQPLHGPHPRPRPAVLEVTVVPHIDGAHHVDVDGATLTLTAGGVLHIQQDPNGLTIEQARLVKAAIEALTDDTWFHPQRCGAPLDAYGDEYCDGVPTADGVCDDCEQRDEADRDSRYHREIDAAWAAR